MSAAEDIKARMRSVDAWELHTVGDDAPPITDEDAPPDADNDGDGGTAKRPRILTLPRTNHTDTGAATVFAQLHKDTFRHVADARYPLIYDGKRWRKATDGDLRRLVVDVVRHLAECASGITDDQYRQAVLDWARKLEGVAKQDAMLKAVPGEASIEVRADELDRRPNLLTVANGTIDLSTGLLRPHRPADLITKLSPHPYIASATAPRWSRFLSEVFNGDKELIEYVRLVVGYCLTGETREQALWVLHGNGSNGKGRFLEVLRSIVGEAARPIAITTLSGKRDQAGANSPDLATLPGARLVTASEPDDGIRFSESLVKDLTGEDPITACAKYEAPFTFVPRFKILLATNYRPTIRGTDGGIWRRLKLVPFTVSFLGREDKQLDEKLRGELPGILAWAVGGAVDWYARGLPKCATVEVATQAYREEQDTIAQFVGDCLVLDKAAWTPTGEVYKSYVAWSERQGEKRPMAQKTLTAKLDGRDGIEQRKRDDVRGLLGVRVSAVKNG